MQQVYTSILVDFTNIYASVINGFNKAIWNPSSNIGVTTYDGGKLLCHSNMNINSPEVINEPPQAPLVGQITIDHAMTEAPAPIPLPVTAPVPIAPSPSKLPINRGRKTPGRKPLAKKPNQNTPRQTRAQLKKIDYLTTIDRVMAIMLMIVTTVTTISAVTFQISLISFRVLLICPVTKS